MGHRDDPARAGALRVVVAVLTFRRTAAVTALVPELAAQARELAERSGASVEVLVVDNDPAGEGAAAVRALRVPGVRAVVEPEPGISAGRNRALDEAATADLLVFIDDDEVPRPAWLVSLVRTWQETGAQAVAGPVVTRFPAEPDPWIVAGGFYARGHRARTRTGDRVAVAATNNLLLDLRFVRDAGLRFDPAFGLTGGEDSLFTTTLTRRGGVIVWCAEAGVEDVLPVERTTRPFVLDRVAGQANASTRVALVTTSGRVRRIGVRLRHAAAGTARLTCGWARAAAGRLLHDDAHHARGHRTAARGRGQLLASASTALQPYGR